jgi:hypothetical protein
MNSALNAGLPATGWLPIFTAANILTDKGKSVKMGKFLTRNVDRRVPIQVNGRTGNATLKPDPCRANEKRYYFEVTWDTPEEHESQATHESPVQPTGRPVALALPATTMAPASPSSVRTTVITSPNPSPTPVGNVGNDEEWA